MMEEGSFGMKCQCPCHELDSGIGFCHSCYVVICKTIRKAADEIGTTATKLIEPFKDASFKAGPGAFEIGR